MSAYSNPSLLHLQSLFVNNQDSHANEGAHVRVAHNPLLTLPVAPFILERADVDTRTFQDLKFREDALFRDQQGNTRIPPFRINKGDEITIHVPSGANNLAIWAEVLMDPSGDSKPQANAYLRSVGQEDVLLGRRDNMRLAFAGTGINRIVLRGVGTVVKLVWINGHEPQKVRYMPIQLLNLPHRGGARYAMLDQWEHLCNIRRDLQSPKRYWLQDTNGAPPRMGAPAYNTNLEHQRIKAFFQELEDPLNSLITGGSPQLNQVILREMVDENGVNISEDGSAELRIRTLGMILQSQADPGMASYCGYKTLDSDKIRDPGHILSLYRITGFFRDPDKGVFNDARERGDAFADLIEQARSQSQLLSPQMVERTWKKRASQLLEKERIDANFDLEQRNCIEICAYAVADHKAPLSEPERPILDKPVHKNWLPGADINTPIRVTETGVRKLMAGGALCATRNQPVGSTGWYILNSELKYEGLKWRALILPSLPTAGPFDSDIPQDGLPDAFLSDATTGPDEFRLFVAQMDRFGRFSEWSNRLGDKGPRPLPPRPVLRGTYQQPDMTTGSHKGTVSLTIPLPEEASLAPGAYPLSQARLSATLDGVNFVLPTVNLPVADAVSIHPDASPPADDERLGLRLQFDGPELVALEEKTLTVTAVWIDDQAQVSEVSEPAKMRMLDPYPPAQTSIPDSLLYSARPDATAKAWVERRWAAGNSKISYAVYYGDENRMREHLRDLGTGPATTLLQSLESEDDPAVRAGLLRTNDAMFPGYLFERLKDVLDDEPDANGMIGFRHALSGSLRILSGYKVAAEVTATSSGPDLSTLDTVYYAVPNSDPPAQPVITAKQTDDDLLVDLTVKLRVGVTQGETVRIRRTRSGVVDPIRNPIIGTAIMGEMDAVTGLQTATFSDNGSALIATSARFQPFIKYAWIAEVQGAPEPGSAATSDGAVAGLWSPVSEAVHMAVVPENAPDAPLFMGQSGIVLADMHQGVSLQFSYAIDLTPTSLGGWTVVVDRRLPDQTVQRIAEETAPAGTIFDIAGDPDDPAALLPSGTVFRVMIIDPIGRESAVTEHIL